MSSGSEAVRQALGPAADGDVTKVYMDDRTFSSSSCQGLLSRVEAWGRWSASVGLCESPSKVQLTAATARGLQELRASAPNPDRVSCDFEVLGVCARFFPRRNTPKEDLRLLAARRTVHILGLLRLPFDRFQREARSFGTCKAAYGWLSRPATMSDAWKLWAAIRAGLPLQGQ